MHTKHLVRHSCLLEYCFLKLLHRAHDVKILPTMQLIDSDFQMSLQEVLLCVCDTHLQFQLQRKCWQWREL